MNISCSAKTPLSIRHDITTAADVKTYRHIPNRVEVNVE